MRPASTRGWRRATTATITAALATLGLAVAVPASAAETPSLAVYLADGTTPYTDQPVADGEKLVVKGSGFDPAGNVGGRGVPIPADLPQGAYVMFGSFASVWQPSKDAPSSARQANRAATVWALAENVLDQVPDQYQGMIRAAWTPIADDGTFTTTIAVTPPETPAVGGVWGIYSYSAGPANAAEELSVPLNYTAAAPSTSAGASTSKAPTSTPATPRVPAATSVSTPLVQCKVETVPATSGTPQLTWGVESGFVSYVEGGIANGRITESGGAARAGQRFTWGTGSGSLASNGAGTLAFPGSVRFTGHDGALDLTISQVKVTVAADGKGTLVATIKAADMTGKDISATNVALASLTFGSVSATGGTAKASLTAAGAAAFAGFYQAGQALDPLSVAVVGAKGATSVERCYDTAGNLVNRDGTPIVAGLASTGVNTTEMVGIGSLLALLGALLIVATRRRGTIPQH